MTTSPIYGDADRPLPRVGAGNDSTLVGAFLSRHCRLSVRTAESSLSTIASSARRVETALAAAKTADLAMVLADGRLRQRAERTMISIFNLFSLRRLRCGVGEGTLREVEGARLNPWSRPSRGGARRPPCRRPR